MGLQGIDIDPKAKEKYCELTSRLRQNFRFENIDVVLSNCSFIAASTDCIAKFHGYGINLVEFNCLLKYRNDLSTIYLCLCIVHCMPLIRHTCQNLQFFINQPPLLFCAVLCVQIFHETIW